MPLDRTEYERLTAIVTHATITRSISTAYPELSSDDRDAMIVGVIDRMARMRGWSVRPEPSLEEAESD